jgi:hypothetical protein
VPIPLVASDVTSSPYTIGGAVVVLGGAMGAVIKWLMSTIDALRKDNKDQNDALLKEVMPLLKDVAVALAAQATTGTKMADTMQSAISELAVIHDRAKGRST